MDESKRRFIKQSVGLLAASGLAAGGAKHAEAVEPPDTPPSMKAPGVGMGEYGSCLWGVGGRDRHERARRDRLRLGLFGAICDRYERRVDRESRLDLDVRRLARVRQRRRRAVHRLRDRHADGDRHL